MVLPSLATCACLQSRRGVFAGLMFLFVTKFVPEYDAIVAAGGAAATALTEQGPKVYYFALTVLAFATASLLFTSSAYLLARGVSARMRNKGENPLWRWPGCSATRPRRPAGT